MKLTWLAPHDDRSSSYSPALQYSVQIQTEAEGKSRQALIRLTTQGSATFLGAWLAGHLITWLCGGLAYPVRRSEYPNACLGRLSHQTAV